MAAMEHHLHKNEGFPHGTLRSYTTGFLASIALTLFAFWIAPQLGTLIYPALVLAALLQLLVQLVFFLHLGRSGGGWNLMVFAFTFVIVGIVVIGTLWIMQNLEHLHMPSPTLNDLYVNGIVGPQNELK